MCWVFGGKIAEGCFSLANVILIGQCLANFKVPRRVAFVEALPRNASGKVTKGALG